MYTETVLTAPQPRVSAGVRVAWRTVAAVLLLVSATAVIQFRRLQDMPTYVTRDESFVGVTGHVLATTGRDLQGRFMPVVFYHPYTDSWWSPALLYLTAAVLKVLPLTEAT